MGVRLGAMTEESRTFHKTFQMRAYTSKEGYARFDEVLGLTRELYNAALQQRRMAYDSPGRHSLSIYEQSRDLTDLRTHDSRHNELSRRIQTGTLRRLEKAYQSFFRRREQNGRGGFPRYKPFGRWRTIDLWGVEASWLKPHTDGPKLDIVIKGLPRLTVRPGEELPDRGKLVNLTLSRRGRRVVVNLTYEVEISKAVERTEQVGLHFGVARRIVSSEGEEVTPVKIDTEFESKKRRLLRRMERQRTQAVKDGRAKYVRVGWRKDRRTGAVAPRYGLRWDEFSQSYGKTRDALGQLEYRRVIRNRNACHRLTTQLVNEHGLIAVPGYDIPRMVESARGTLEQPGEGVERKRRLNRLIQAQTWGQVRQQLAYKAEWAGREFVVVEPPETASRCRRCGNVDRDARKSARSYHCGICGHREDAAVNAAKNILRIAQAGLPGLVPDGAKLLSSGAAGPENNRLDKAGAPGIPP